MKRSFFGNVPQYQGFQDSSLNAAKYLELLKKKRNYKVRDNLHAIIIIDIKMSKFSGFTIVKFIFTDTEDFFQLL